MLPWALSAVGRALRYVGGRADIFAVALPTHRSGPFLLHDWTEPLVIVGASGPCGRGHCLLWPVPFAMWANTPTYLPSNAIVPGAGACAAAGMAKTKIAAAKTALVWPDIGPPL